MSRLPGYVAEQEVLLCYAVLPGLAVLPGYVAEQGVLFGYAVLPGYVAEQGVLFGYLFCLAILLSRKFLGRTVFLPSRKSPMQATCRTGA